MDRHDRQHPPSSDPHATRRLPDNRPFIYIGEYRGGRDAPGEFFEGFHLTEDLQFSLSSWYGFHDAALIGYYRPAPAEPNEREETAH